MRLADLRNRRLKHALSHPDSFVVGAAGFVFLVFCLSNSLCAQGLLVRAHLGHGRLGGDLNFVDSAREASGDFGELFSKRLFQ